MLNKSVSRDKQIKGLNRREFLTATLGHERQPLEERIASRQGLRQISAMTELKMGNPKYRLVSLG